MLLCIFWKTLLFHGEPRSKVLFLTLLLRQNIEQWQPPHVRSLGYLYLLQDLHVSHPKSAMLFYDNQAVQI